ncbi:MAG: carbohydrate binding domain-containing protein [Lentisphaeria bacterium]
MRTMILGSIFLVCSLVAAFEKPAKNYVREGDFSEGMSGWHFFAGKTAGSVVNEGPDGSRCFKISGVQEAGIYLYNKGTQSWSMDLVEGETYTCSYWVKTENVKNTFAGNFLFLINYGWTQSVPFGAEATTDGWVKKEYTFQAPPQGKQLNPAQYRYSFLLYWPKGADGTVWLRQLQIERGSKASEFTPLWNFQVEQVLEKVEKCLTQVQKTQASLAKNFPDAGDLRAEVDADLQKLLTWQARLTNPALLTNKLCTEAEAEMAAITSALGKKLCPVWLKEALQMSRERDFPDTIERDLGLRLKLYRRQTREFAIMISNLSGDSADFRVMPGEFLVAQRLLSGRDFITLYNAPLLPGSKFRSEHYTDALPVANQIGGLTVPGGSTRQVLVSLSTKGLSPGNYRGSIRIAATTNPEYDRDLLLEFEVLPVELCRRAPIDVGPFGCYNFLPQEVEELGHNVLAIDTGSFTPVMGKDHRLQPLNFASLQDRVKNARKLVPNCKFMLIFSIGPRFMTTTKLPWSDVRVQQAWREFVQQLAAEISKLGLSGKDFLLQVEDEPSAAGIEQSIDMQRMAQKAGLKMMSALTSFSAKEANIQEFYRQLDYPVVITKVTREPEALAFYRQNCSRLGFYDCDGFAEYLDSTVYCRLMSWRAWRHQLDGYYYWYRDDRFKNWEMVKYMSVVYELRDGNAFETRSPLRPGDDFVISRRWLGMRAAYQDYKMLYQLQQSAAKLEAVGLVPELVAKAKAFLDEAPQRALTLDDPIKYPLPGKGDPGLLNQLNEQCLELHATLVAESGFALSGKPSLSKEGRLRLAANQPCRLEIRYLLAGQLPWLQLSKDDFTLDHQVTLAPDVSKCEITIISENGQILTASPFIQGTVAADSIFMGEKNGYRLFSAVDGERLPAVQYHPFNTWISDAASGEHWICLTWPQEQVISRVIVAWMAKGGVPQKIRLQYLDLQGNWQDIDPDWRTASDTIEKITFPPRPALGVRFLQAPNGGNPTAPSLMGVSEFEVF